jgi:hypothetical protein
MTATRLVGISLLCCALASPAVADVTLKSKNTGAAATGGDTTQYVKGLKMRLDQAGGKGQHTSSIIDMAARQMIVLDHEKKEASVLDMAALGATIDKVGGGELTTSITPTAQTRQIAGQTCTVYNLRVSVPMEIAKGMAMTMVMSGPQCLVKNGPGQADYAAFYKAAADKGGFMDATTAKARPGIAKAQMEMAQKMAELGVPFATELKIGVEGSGPMADMMKKMDNTISSEVTSVSTAPIAAAMFEVPADYKVSKR